MEAYTKISNKEPNQIASELLVFQRANHCCLNELEFYNAAALLGIPIRSIDVLTLQSFSWWRSSPKRLNECSSRITNITFNHSTRKKSKKVTGATYTNDAIFIMCKRCSIKTTTKNLEAVLCYRTLLSKSIYNAYLWLFHSKSLQIWWHQRAAAGTLIARSKLVWIHIYSLL